MRASRRYADGGTPDHGLGRKLRLALGARTVRPVRVLLTGVSGAGKSSLVNELRRRGYLAYDADDDRFTEPGPDGTWGWRQGLVRSLFDRHDNRLLYFAGCSEEQAQFEFDFKVLLTAPVEVLLERLRTRTTNTFGKSQTDQARVLADMEWVLPLLTSSADLIVDTTPVSAVADVVVDAIASRDPRNTQS
jgi:shikimate kinase